MKLLWFLFFIIFAKSEFFLLPKVENFQDSNPGETLELIPNDICFQILNCKNSKFKSNVNEIFQYYSKNVFHSDNNNKNCQYLVKIHIENPVFFYPKLETNEIYEIIVDKKATLIKSENYFGFLRAIETFSQLFKKKKINSRRFLQKNKKSKINLRLKEEILVLENLPIVIKDKPSFHHRGFMLDTARHFYSKKSILKALDGMMHLKMNVFHWHLTDSESFPFQSKAFPEISKAGAYSPEEIYSYEDMKEIVNHAAKRGIRVIAELDNPAHMRSWGLSEKFFVKMILRYQNIVVCQDSNCPAPPCGQLNPAEELSYTVLEGIFNEVKEIFPDAFIHIGNDEVVECWQNYPKIQEWMEKKNFTSTNEVMEYHRSRLKKIIGKNKKIISWRKSLDEQWNISSDDYLQFWGSSSNIPYIKILKIFRELLSRSSAKLILSPNDALYLDCGLINIYGDYTWCSLNTWKTIKQFSFQNYSNQVIGGEGVLWSEGASEHNMESVIWQRLIVLADNLWKNDENDNQIKEKRF